MRKNISLGGATMKDARATLTPWDYLEGPSIAINVIGRMGDGSGLIGALKPGKFSMD